MIPFVEVSHLPSSTSFYSAILQPLGLQYLATIPHDTHYIGGSRSGTDTRQRGVVFGAPVAGSESRPILHIREVSGTPRQSRAVFSANSPEAVEALQFCAQRSFPTSLKSEQHNGVNSLDFTKAGVLLIDMDGNIVEAVCTQPSTRAGTTEHQAARILRWEYDVAKLSSHPTSRSGRLTAPSASGSKQQNSDLAYGSFSNAEVKSSNVGTVAGLITIAAAGVAMGAAITYNAMKNDSTRAPGQGLGQVDQDKRTPETKTPFFEYQAEISPRRMTNNNRVRANGYKTECGPPTAHATRDSGAQDRVPSRYGSEIESCTGPFDYGHRSPVPCFIADAPDKNQAGSVRSSRPSGLTSHGSVHGTDQKSFVSARSQQTDVRFLNKALRAGSTAPTNQPSPVLGGCEPVSLPQSRKISVVTPCNIPLPKSNIGSSHAGWDDQDSIAPSDSVSCVGSQRSRRSRAFESGG
jgi:hypothetical protein